MASSDRPQANFSPSLWGDFFCSFDVKTQVSGTYVIEIEKLKEDVRNMLMSRRNTAVDKIILIDTLERLGVSYHFENEIEDNLHKISDIKEDLGDDDLFYVALKFRLLRQHGFKMSSSVFKNFIDSDGIFKKEHKNDIKGLLSLYEAAYLRIKGEETILDEVLSFSTAHLKVRAPNSSSTILEKQVDYALGLPLHKSIPRVEARQFISLYEEDDSKNEILLRLAKLDFNLVQMQHRKELSDLSRWYKEVDFTTKLSYARDRLVECFYWVVGVYYEPQYSRARVMFTKVIVMISILDDTYDSYGKLPELQVFNDAVQRWNIDEIDQLPDYMKILYEELLNLFEKLDEELREEGRSYAVNYIKEAMKQIVRSYYTEAKWFIEGYIPNFAEYMRNALYTSTYYVLLPASYLGMKSATNEVFAWQSENPKILLACCTMCRVLDDTATFKEEKTRGQIATGIECYMRDNNLSKEDAFDKFHEMAENAWKDMNEECLKPTSMPSHILLRVINLARIVEVTYSNDLDGYTHPEKLLKKHIESLLVNPISTIFHLES